MNNPFYHGERLRLKLLTSSRQYALAYERVDIPEQRSNSEFIFRTRRNSKLSIPNSAELQVEDLASGWSFRNSDELRVHFRNSAEVEVQIFVPVGFFPGPIGKSEFIFRTRRNSEFTRSSSTAV